MLISVYLRSFAAKELNARAAIACYLMRKSTLPLLALIFAFHATPAGKFALSIDNIMRGPGLYGYEPAQVRWSGDGERIYFQWKQASDPLLKDLDTYVVGRDGSGLKKLSDEEAKLAPPAFGDTSESYSLALTISMS